MTRVVVNRSYGQQRVSGQQRYAAEIGARLAPAPAFRAAEPPAAWRRSTGLVWAWVQLVLPVLAGRRVVLSMTARAPVWSRRHVVVVHDLFAIRHPEWFSRAYYWSHAPLLRAQIRTAAALVAVSQPVADELAAMGRPDVAVAPNAPSEVFSVVDASPSAVLAAHEVAPGSYFLAVGNRDPRKNLGTLAKAYAALPPDVRRQHPLVLVGGGAAIYRDEAIGWPEGTIDAGYVDDDELRRLYRDSGTVVFVSLAEGFGLPLVESVAAGASSLLISDIDVFRWICGGGARYVDPHSVSAVAQGMLDELTTPTPHSVDLSRFSWQQSAATVSRVCLTAGDPR